MTPLDQFVARWSAVQMPIPFIEVVNTDPELNTLPDLWGSALMQSDQRSDVTLGSFPWVEESGQIIVGMFARAGTGRNGLDEATAQLRRFFHGYMTADNSLHFTSVIGPEDIDPQADGEWWRLGFTIPFVRQTRRAEPVPQVPDDPVMAAWVLEVVTQGGSVSAQRRTLINDVVTALRTAGLLPKLSRLWFHANENQVAAEIDLIALDRVELVGAPIFTPDIGFTGNRSDPDGNTHLATHYQPDGTDAWTLASNHCAVYIYNDRTDGAPNNMGGQGETVISYVNVMASGNIYASIQGTGNINTGVPTAKGYTLVNIKDGHGALFKNGVKLYEQDAVAQEYFTAPWNLMAGPSLAFRSDDTHCVFHFGAGLTPLEAETLSDIINGMYLAQIGAARY